MDRWMNGQMDGWTDGSSLIDERSAERIDGWITNKKQKNEQNKENGDLCFIFCLIKHLKANIHNKFKIPHLKHIWHTTQCTHIHMHKCTWKRTHGHRQTHTNTNTETLTRKKTETLRLGLKYLGYD